jgi:hypothetical protein
MQHATIYWRVSSTAHRGWRSYGLAIWGKEWLHVIQLGDVGTPGLYIDPNPEMSSLLELLFAIRAYTFMYTYAKPQCYAHSVVPKHSVIPYLNPNTTS